MNDNIEPIVLNSTDEHAVNELVMSLIQTNSKDYTILNQEMEDITKDIRKLVSFKMRMLKR